MKISDITKLAKSRFSMLLTGDSEINAFLSQALTTYQDIAGCIRTIEIEAPTPESLNMPEYFLAHAMCKDFYGDFVIVNTFDQDDGTTKLRIDDDPVYPLKYEFFVNLTYYADKPDSHIPNRISGVITDYLECLIAMDNDDRVARAETAGKMDASRMPTRLDRLQQKQTLEDKMRESRAMISMASIHPRG